jgi:AcrR family transcriptional regulator
MSSSGRKTILRDKTTPKTRTLREELRQVTHERLLNAAKELLEKKNAESITVDQIAKHAGTNRTTFYLHFEDKTDIAFKIRARYRSGDIQTISRYLSGPDGISKADISSWIRHRARFFSKHREIIKLGTESLNKRPEHVREFLDQTREILKTAFAGFLSRFGDDEQDLVLAELLLCSVMLNRYLYMTVIQDLKMPFKKAPDAMVNIWFNLLTRRPDRKRKSKQ